MSRKRGGVPVERIFQAQDGGSEARSNAKRREEKLTMWQSRADLVPELKRAMGRWSEMVSRARTRFKMAGPSNNPATLAGKVFVSW